MTLRRLDTELVRRGLARSRTHGRELIDSGRVEVNGQVSAKPARQVDENVSIKVVEQTDEEDYVSRGAYKLLGALDDLGDEGPSIDGKRCLDAGASTGGFTDVLLHRGAASVLAVDVGYGQLAWKLRTDPRVEPIERTNIRYLTPDQIGEPPTLVVGDLSFISLSLVLPALRTCAPTAEMLLMVKPQFEVGRQDLGSGGVVRDQRLHLSAVKKVADAARECGMGVIGVAPSPLPGPAGNVEYFLYLSPQCNNGLEGDQLLDAIERAIERGPAAKNSEKES